MLNIEEGVDYSDVVTGCEYHTHKPYASTTFKNNDEIRIPISQQDIITAPFDSTLHISGTISGKKTGGADADVSLVNNAICFLFEDIRFEVGGIVVDRTKNVGITSTIKNLLSVREAESKILKNACWLGPGNTVKLNKFTFSVPLRMLLGFAEDYRKIMVNIKQELILLRAASDKNALLSADADNLALEITDLYWRVPHLTVSDRFKEKLLKQVDKDMPVHLPFRSWELHEYPALPTTNRFSWTVKTSSQLEKPRYVVLAFQTDRKDKSNKDMSCFDNCSLTDVKLYLNSQYYPYDNIRGDYCVMYSMYANFQKSYYETTHNSPIMDYDTFKDTCPLYVIDCSKQNDTIKSGPVDVRLEFETKENIKANTTAYCLLLHDSHLVYTLLTGSVKRVI